MDTISPAESTRKPTGLVRGQAAKIARIHRVSITYVLKVARGELKGRPQVVATIQEYRDRNAQPSA